MLYSDEEKDRALGAMGKALALVGCSSEPFASSSSSLITDGTQPPNDPAPPHSPLPRALEKALIEALAARFEPFAAAEGGKEKKKQEQMGTGEGGVGASEGGAEAVSVGDLDSAFYLASNEAYAAAMKRVYNLVVKQEEERAVAVEGATAAAAGAEATGINHMMVVALYADSLMQVTGHDDTG